VSSNFTNTSPARARRRLQGWRRNTLVYVSYNEGYKAAAASIYGTWRPVRGGVVAVLRRKKGPSPWEAGLKSEFILSNGEIPRPNLALFATPTTNDMQFEPSIRSWGATAHGQCRQLQNQGRG